MIHEYIILIGTAEGRSLVRSSNERDNVKIDLEGIECDGVDWNYPANYKINRTW
jgi:hypothetical protein